MNRDIRIFQLNVLTNETNIDTLLWILQSVQESLPLFNIWFLLYRQTQFLHEIQLYDQNGRLLEQLRDLDQGQLFNLQMGHYEKGVYFLQLKTSNTVEREKIIKW